MSGARRERPVLLVVDDETAILSALRRTLRREGWSILTAETPAEGLRLIEQHAVDAVLSDQKMPGMSGLEFLWEVARRRPAAARLLLTGWPDEIPADQRRRIGIRALLPKPWDADALKSALRACLPR